jgi:1-acyl-sn-glycerol-3-phosphate acyltransferase
LGIGNHIKFTVHKPLELANFTNKAELILEVEKTIVKFIKN